MMSSRVGDKSFVVLPVTGVTTRLRVKFQARAAADRASWLPGTELPKHLDGSLPGQNSQDSLDSCIVKRIYSANDKL